MYLFIHSFVLSTDIRLKKFGEEKKELEDQVRRLKLELEEEKNKNRRRKENGLDYDRQSEYRGQGPFCMVKVVL